jgi:NADH dehydrogenase (ubiquinone) Fe-S protein 1
MVKVFINNEVTYVPSNSTVLEACESIGIEVPRFCFHERLSVAGNCRMCLVELEKSPKPVASCAMPVMNNMQVFTETPLVKKAREGVLEFLLMNHPLDCPICDQGGECDLQDQAMFFGSDKSRFFEYKRGVEDKNCGPLIKTIMTRCIHCTRCVRFAMDIAGVEDLGTTNRGRDTEIGTYVGKVFQSELSGNVVDLCPVGALTSKPYTFIARPWELRSTETIDISDAVGSNIRVDFKETEVVRVLPRLNEELNEEWISDKTRFSFDALKIQRLDTPYIKENNSLKQCSWQIAMEKLKNLLLVNDSSKTSFLCSVNTDLRTLNEAKFLANSLGIKNFGYPRSFNFNSDFSKNYICNTSLSDIEHSDLCILVGVNPRYEASMLNLKLRKRHRQGLYKTVSIGVPHNLTYQTEVLGVSPYTLIEISEGKHPICKELRTAKKPIILYSSSLAERKDFPGLEKSLGLIEENLKEKAPTWNTLSFLNQESNQVGAFELGIESFDFSELKGQNLCVLLGSFRQEELNKIIKEVSNNTQLVFIGTNGCESTAKADLILPTTTFFEKDGLYMNLEGRIQKTQKATTGPALVRDSLKIIRILKKRIASLGLVSYLKDPEFSTINLAKRHLFFLKSNKKTLSTISRLPFSPFLTDFYISDSLSKNSTTMAKCSGSYRADFKNFF